MATFGGVAEWSIAPVLKTGNPKGFVSSNLTASARYKKAQHLLRFFIVPGQGIPRLRT